MSAAKRKAPKVTKAQEQRRRAAWERRFAGDLCAANQKLAEQGATLKAVLDVQKLLLRNLERLLREKDALTKHVVEGAPLQFDTLPDDFEVFAFRHGSRL